MKTTKLLAVSALLFAGLCAASAEAATWGEMFRLLWVDPYTDVPYLPDKAPKYGVETNILSCAAAQGEIETISFSVEPSRDLKKVDFVPSELIGPGGARIPASAADFALVKVWYRAGGRWRTSWCGSLGNPELMNDLVIHDDDLVRVVEDKENWKRTIKVRIDYPEGPAYVDMRKHGESFNHGLHPIRDTKTFVPFNLTKGRWQQYWFTWRVPKTAKPGVYRGSLAVKEGGVEAGAIPVEIEVYPFSLPMARTHYDTSQPFISAWMGTPSLGGELAKSKDMKVAETRLRNVYRSLAEHNCHCPSGPGAFGNDTTEDYAVRSLIMMRQEGMAVRLLINGMSFMFHESGTNEYAKMIRTQANVLDKYIGHRDCYFCSADECDTGFNRASYQTWSMLHANDFKTWTDYGVSRDISWSVSMNDVPASARHVEAWNWHAGGAKAVTYAGPFTGPLCPDIWRRTKGLRYYYGDYDGHHEYCFYCGENPWNDFTFRSAYSQFVIVYPTYDGLIASTAWEGVREGLDDIRYLSLLKLRCEAAIRTKDRKIRDAGLRNLLWMESQDPETVIDLFAFRRETARRIVEMIALVGPEPEEVLPKPPPELPPLACDVEPRPAGAKREELASKYKNANRWDLAIPLYRELAHDETIPTRTRYDHVAALVGMLSDMLHRDEALREIDAFLKVRDLKSVQRAKLSLLRVRTMMTNRIFAEEFTTEQLDVAAAAIADALSRPGATGGERFGAVSRVVNGYLAGGQPQKAIDFAEARMQDVKFDPGEKASLFLCEARGWTALKNYEMAARMYRVARVTNPGCVDRGVLQAEGWVAEQLEDWKTAEKCYAQEATTYNEEEYALKSSCVGRLKRVMAKLQASERKKDISFDDTDDGTAIELDE